MGVDFVYPRCTRNNSLLKKALEKVLVFQFSTSLNQIWKWQPFSSRQLQFRCSYVPFQLSIQELITKDQTLTKVKNVWKESLFYPFCNMQKQNVLSCSVVVPDALTEASGTGDEPNHRDMKLRFWGADTGVTEDWRCSGDWAEDFNSAEGEAALPTAAARSGAEGGDTEGDCGSGCEGIGGWGVLGLELPVEAPLGGTMGDWEPEEGLWPLAGPGEP